MPDTQTDEPTEEQTAFERFETFAKNLLAVPRREIEEQREKRRKP